MNTPPDDENGAKPAAPLTTALAGILCAALIGFALAGEFEVIDHGLAKRIVGGIIGAMLLIMGNLLPKFAVPTSLQNLDPRRFMAAERFAGWVFVLAGVAAMASSVLLPLDRMLAVEAVIGVAAFGIVALAWVVLTRGGPVPTLAELAPDGPADATSPRSRTGILLILHGLFWVFMIFLIDSIWGDQAAQWTAIIFALVTAVLVSVKLPKLIGRGRGSK